MGDWQDEARFKYEPKYNQRQIQAEKHDLEPDELWDSERLKEASMDIRKNNLGLKVAAKKYNVRQKDLRLYYDEIFNEEKFDQILVQPSSRRIIQNPPKKQQQQQQYLYSVRDDYNAEQIFGDKPLKNQNVYGISENSETKNNVENKKIDKNTYLLNKLKAELKDSDSVQKTRQKFNYGNKVSKSPECLMRQQYSADFDDEDDNFQNRKTQNQISFSSHQRPIQPQVLIPGLQNKNKNKMVYNKVKYNSKKNLNNYDDNYNKKDNIGGDDFVQGLLYSEKDLVYSNFNSNYNIDNEQYDNNRNKFHCASVENKEAVVFQNIINSRNSSSSNNNNNNNSNDKVSGRNTVNGSQGQDTKGIYSQGQDTKGVNSQEQDTKGVNSVNPCIVQYPQEQDTKGINLGEEKLVRKRKPKNQQIRQQAEQQEQHQQEQGFDEFFEQLQREHVEDKQQQFQEVQKKISPKRKMRPFKPDLTG